MIMSPIGQEAHGLHALHDVHAKAKAAGVGLLFAQRKGPVRDMMARAGLTDKIGCGAFSRTLEDALEVAEEMGRSSQQEGGDDGNSSESTKIMTTV